MATTTSTPILSELTDLIGHLLRKSHLVAQRSFAEAFDGTDISPVQYGLLSIIGSNPDVSHKDLAKAVATAPSVATTALKPLLEENLVQQRRDHGDARSSTYRLSSKGASFLNRMRERIALASQRLEAPLTKAESDTLRKLLAKLVAASLR
jgi:DNA-binding MarR family transcriptional regulator